MKKLIAMLLILSLLVLGLVACDDEGDEGDGTTTTTTTNQDPPQGPGDEFDPPYKIPDMNDETPGIELPPLPVN